MSIWGDIKKAGGGMLENAISEVSDYGNEYVSNIWGDSSPAQEEKAVNAENLAAIPRAVSEDKSGSGSLLPAGINWQAVAAIASAAAVVVMLVRNR